MGCAKGVYSICVVYCCSDLLFSLIFCLIVVFIIGNGVLTSLLLLYCLFLLFCQLLRPIFWASAVRCVYLIICCVDGLAFSHYKMSSVSSNSLRLKVYILVQYSCRYTLLMLYVSYLFPF